MSVYFPDSSFLSFIQVSDDRLLDSLSSQKDHLLLDRLPEFGFRSDSGFQPLPSCFPSLRL